MLYIEVKRKTSEERLEETINSGFVPYGTSPIFEAIRLSKEVGVYDWLEFYRLKGGDREAETKDYRITIVNC